MRSALVVENHIIFSRKSRTAKKKAICNSVWWSVRQISILNRNFWKINGFSIIFTLLSYINIKEIILFLCIKNIQKSILYFILLSIDLHLSQKIEVKYCFILIKVAT